MILFLLMLILEEDSESPRKAVAAMASVAVSAERTNRRTDDERVATNNGSVYLFLSCTCITAIIPEVS